MKLSYTALAEPARDYARTVWGGINICNVNSLRLKKEVRIIAGVPPRERLIPFSIV